MRVAVAEYANDVPIGQDSIVIDTSGGQSLTLSTAGVRLNVTAAEAAVAVTAQADAALTGRDLTVTLAQGLQGPQGPPGSATVLTYQLAGVASWSQGHTFPYPPEVQLVDAVGERVYLTAQYPSPSSVYLLFPTPFTGKVILR